MKKIIFAFVVIIISACSSTKTVTKVEIDKYKNLTAPDGKSIVYFVRPSFVGAIISFKVSCNDSLIGSTIGKRYLFTVLNPGKYQFTSEAENTAELQIEVEANKVYYVEQKPKMGVILARNQLELLTQEEGKTKLAKCSLSTKFTPPDF